MCVPISLLLRAILTRKWPVSYQGPRFYENLQDILDQPIKTNGDAVVRIRDIAYVERGFKQLESYARLDGRPAIGIEVTKRIGMNVIETVENVRAIVAEIKKPGRQASP